MMDGLCGHGGGFLSLNDPAETDSQQADLGLCPDLVTVMAIYESYKLVISVGLYIL